MIYTQVELPLMIFFAAVSLLNRSTVSEAPKKKRKPISVLFFCNVQGNGPHSNLGHFIFTIVD